MKSITSLLCACVLALGTTASLAQQNPRVTLQTSKGTIVIELFADKAPKSAENFLKYVRDGHYDGTIFHRVIPGFVVQGGGFTKQMTQRPTHPPVVNEAKNGLPNLRGTLSMARTSDPDSATSQFFINLVDNAMLNRASDSNPGYAVFGKVVEGLSVVDAMATVPTTRVGPYGDVPMAQLVLEKATVNSK